MHNRLRQNFFSGQAHAGVIVILYRSREGTAHCSMLWFF
jgi:hypothetical protein